MPLIKLTTFIATPCEKVFDLSRSLKLHQQSMKKYNESIVNTTSNGTVELNDEVMWKARHLWKERFLKVKITALHRPGYFCDEQISGDFAAMKHEHFFKPVENGTLMIDHFEFETPYGSFGRLFNRLYLESYMRRLLLERNRELKKIAEQIKVK
jgi:ligand-binding SRPBCC domain-containing protein